MSAQWSPVSYDGWMNNRRIVTVVTVAAFVTLCFLFSAVLITQTHAKDPSVFIPVRTVPGKRFHFLIILGTFSTAPQVVHRAAIRNTWASTPFICSNKPSKRSRKCTVWHYFVVGNSPTLPTGESLEHKDIMFLADPENMNDGKTFDYFKRALEMHPEADYFAKTDMDTFVDVSNLMRMLWYPMPHVYFGFENSFFICGGIEICPKDWQYMSGQLYILGRSLVLWLANNEDLHFRKGDEDLQIGRTLQLFNGPLLYYPCNRAGIRCPFIHNIKNHTQLYDIWTVTQLEAVFDYN